MYRIQILDKTNSPVTTLPPNDVELRSFSKTINKAGTCIFSINLDSPFAIKDNFALLSRVSISRWDGSSYVRVWVGFMESILENNGRLEIGCKELIDIFDKRISGNLTLTGNAGTEIFSMLSTTNSDDDTGITAGTNAYTTTLDQKIDKKSLLDAWEDIAKTEDSEYEIDLDFNLNLGPLGTDKSSTVRLVYNELRPQENTLNETRINETADRLVNRITGISKTKAGAALTATVEDASSIAAFGLFEKVVSFNDAESVGALTDLIQTELDNLKDPIDNPSVTPKQLETIENIAGDTKTIGIDVMDIALGDIVQLCYNTNWTTIDTTRRIVSFTVTVDTTGAETISLKLNKPTQNKELLTTERDAEQSRDSIRRDRQLENRVFN
jgi:hypothetical protein